MKPRNPAQLLFAQRLVVYVRVADEEMLRIRHGAYVSPRGRHSRKWYTYPDVSPVITLSGKVRCRLSPIGTDVYLFLTESWELPGYCIALKR